MTIYGGGIRGLRRRNWAASGHDREGRQRGNAEEEEGFKGEGTGLPLLLLNAGNQAGKKRAETAMGFLLSVEEGDVMMTSSFFFSFSFY